RSRAIARRAGIAAAGESAGARGAVLGGLAAIGARLGRALRLAVRLRAATGHEAWLAAGRPGRALDDLAMAALVHERRGRLARGAAHVRPVVGCPGAIAVVGYRPARRREVGSVGAGRITLRVAALDGEYQE